MSLFILLSVALDLTIREDYLSDTSFIKKWRLPLVLLVFALEAIILLLVIQYMQLGNFQNVYSWFMLHKKIYLFSVILLMLFGWGITSIINRLWISNSLFIDIILVFGFVNNQKMTFRQEPLLSSDLTMVSNAGQLASMISFTHILTLIILCILIVLLNYFGFKFLRFPTHTLHLSSRIIGLIVMSMMIFSFFRVNHTNSLSAKVFTKFGDASYVWSLKDSADNNGPLIAFINSIDMTVMDKPAGYSQKKMQSIAKKYTKVANSINQERSQSDINKQTLIYVLSESFSDPTRVPNLKISANPMPNINKIKRETTSGTMLSSGYGGGTANMEYMVDTSLNLSFFSKTMTTPFTQLVPNQKNAYAITDLFKTKNAIHTFTGTLYRRVAVYKKFGFQTFRSTDSTGSQKLHYAKKIQKSDLIGDNESYNNVLWQLRHTQTGQFISLATMQNHMPYVNRYYHVPYKISGKASKGAKKEIATYTEGVHLTDQSTRTFINQLNKIHRPITVLWYGDHLPGIYNHDSMARYNIKLHEPDYFIYSNTYARQHGYGQKKLKHKSGVVGSNALSALVLAQMNQKVTPYYALITKVLTELPAMATNSQKANTPLLVNQNNKQTSLRKLNAKQRKLYNDYQLIQYDLTAGKSYLSKTDFMTKIK